MNTLYDGMDEDEKALCALMSDISEKCWCAGWLDGTEYILWGMLNMFHNLTLTHDSLHWGQDSVDIVELVKLSHYSHITKKWIVWSDLGNVAVDIPQWELIYAEATR